MGRNSKAQDIICFCNNVPRDVIENAIAGGAKTMNEIFDCTQAGVGPCGGSCRRKMEPILLEFLKTGKFPAPAAKPKK